MVKTQFDVNLTHVTVEGAANDSSARRCVHKRLREMSDYQDGWQLIPVYQQFRREDEFEYKIYNNTRLDTEVQKLVEMYA